tara:strand:+ start:1840 stop:2514 length:675 start_codon:yes stop_codon:yes gene_type:complete
MLEKSNKNSLRFIKCFEQSGLSQIKFANSLSTSSGHVNEILKGKKNASYALSKLAEALIESLSGSGLTDVSDKATQGEGESGKGLKGDLKGNPRTVSVPVHAFAGAGGPVEIWEHDPVQFVDIPAHWMKPSIQSAIIRGRSMEPTIVDGAVVGVDTEFKQIISGEMYALWMDYEGAIVKRLYVEKDVLRIVSDNKDFPEMRLGRDEINEESFILGKVSWLMQSY